MRDVEVARSDGSNRNSGGDSVRQIPESAYGELGKSYERILKDRRLVMHHGIGEKPARACPFERGPSWCWKGHGYGKAVRQQAEKYSLSGTFR